MKFIKLYKEHIDWEDFDDEEEDINNLLNYVNKDAMQLNRNVIKIPHQNLQKFIDELNRLGFTWSNGREIYNNDEFVKLIDDNHYILLYDNVYEHYKITRLMRIPHSDEFNIIEFN